MFTVTYLLQLTISREVTAHKHARFLPLQYVEGKQQPHEGVILTGVNDQFVSHFSFGHVLALLLRTVIQTVPQHLQNTTALHLIHTRENL